MARAPTEESTTVTRQPAMASGTALVPLPPPTSTTCGGAPVDSGTTSPASARSTGSPPHGRRCSIIGLLLTDVHGPACAVRTEAVHGARQAPHAARDGAMPANSPQRIGAHRPS